MLNRLVATRINCTLHTKSIKHIWMGNRSKIEPELPPHLKDAKSFDRNAQFEDPMIKYVRPDRKYFVGFNLFICKWLVSVMCGWSLFHGFVGRLYSTYTFRFLSLLINRLIHGQMETHRIYIPLER